MITTENFEEKVLKSDKPFLLDFMADWCPPCKAMGPTIEQLKEELKDTCYIDKLNIDDSDEVASKYAIQSIPCFVLFKNGEEIGRKIGMLTKQDLKAFIESGL
jgi:thioredoxin 1